MLPDTSTASDSTSLCPLLTIHFLLLFPGRLLQINLTLLLLDLLPHLSVKIGSLLLLLRVAEQASLAQIVRAALLLRLLVLVLLAVHVHKWWCGT